MTHNQSAPSDVFAPQLDPAEQAVYQLALRTLVAAGVPFVVGGAFAVYQYTGLGRNTQDLDLFLLPGDVTRALAALAGAGFRTRVEAESWLAKASRGASDVDLIFGSSNWLAAVDRAWLDRSTAGRLLGVPVRFAPVEELIWSKAYVAGRGRYDAADILHLLLRVLGAGRPLDWEHLQARFGNQWQLLFSYLCLFRYAYPHDRGLIPPEVLAALVARQRELPRKPRGRRICRGTLLDRYSYNHDIARGYHDPREDLAAARGLSRAAVVRERKRARAVTGQA